MNDNRQNPTFSAAHYRAIAALLKSSEAPHYVVAEFMCSFGLDNPRFDKQKFLEAIRGKDRKIKSTKRVIEFLRHQPGVLGVLELEGDYIEVEFTNRFVNYICHANTSTWDIIEFCDQY